MHDVELIVRKESLKLKYEWFAGIGYPLRRKSKLKKQPSGSHKYLKSN